MSATIGSQALMAAVESRLTQMGASAPALLDRARVDKIYEIYVLTCLVKALKRHEARLIPYDSVGRPTNTLRFRMAPGLLYGPASQPSYISVKLGKHEYEIQNSLRVVGSSGVLHELDVCLIEHQKANQYRQASMDLGHKSVLFFAECKYYGSNLPLHLGREYLGLSSEFRVRVKTLVSNRDNLEVKNLVTGHKGTFTNNVTPWRFKRVEEFIGWIANELDQVLRK